MSIIKTTYEYYRQSGVVELIKAIQNRMTVWGTIGYHLAENPNKVTYLYEDIEFLSPWETLEYLLENEVGIARYGDAELQYVCGLSTNNEDHSTFLSSKLRNIASSYNSKTYNEEYLLGMPLSRVWGEQANQSYWSKMHKYSMQSLIKKGALYGSSICFRPKRDELRQKDRSECIDKIESIFYEKDVIYIADKNRLNDHIGVEKFIEIPPRNAWKNYEKLKRVVVTQVNNYQECVVLVSAGSTGCALSAELNRSGILTYDIGNFYEEYGYQIADPD
jgi:hypothetical protein